jgi:hypothetical protein
LALRGRRFSFLCENDQVMASEGLPSMPSSASGLVSSDPVETITEPSSERP